MKIPCLILAGAILVNGVGTGNAQKAIVKSEFIFEKAPFASCHASTIEDTPEGLVAAWFGGTEEGALDVGIWVSRHDGQRWSEPVEVATGYDEKKRIQYPCWNPVLFRPTSGPLYLFYKQGPSPSRWWGMIKSSSDGGKTWGRTDHLPPNILGPIKNKPVELPSGIILSGSSTEHAGWRVHMERTRDPYGVWLRTEPLNSAMEFSAIQPTILLHAPDRIQILCRSKVRGIVESWSADGGKTWSRMRRTGLPNPNAGIDAVVLRDGRGVLVHNNTDRGRGVLSLALTEDGKDWWASVELENEPGAEFSYPAIIQGSDGQLHITYTWKRKKIKYVVIDPAALTKGAPLGKAP